MGAFSTVTHHLGRCLARLRNRRHDRNDERGVGEPRCRREGTRGPLMLVTPVHAPHSLQERLSTRAAAR